MNGFGIAKQIGLISTRCHEKYWNDCTLDSFYSESSLWVHFIEYGGTVNITASWSDCAPNSIESEMI